MDSGRIMHTSHMPESTYVFDVKLARDGSVVIIPHGTDDRLSSKRESQSCDHVFVVTLRGIDVIVHTRKGLRRRLHKHMRKQWIPGTLSPSSVPGFEARTRRTCI